MGSYFQSAELNPIWDVENLSVQPNIGHEHTARCLSSRVLSTYCKTLFHLYSPPAFPHKMYWEPGWLWRTKGWRFANGRHRAIKHGRCQCHLFSGCPPKANVNRAITTVWTRIFLLLVSAVVAAQCKLWSALYIQIIETYLLGHVPFLFLAVCICPWNFSFLPAYSYIYYQHLPFS